MSFELNAFRQASFQPREGSVPLPELEAFFAKDEKPVFKIRMLSSNELHRADNAIPLGNAAQELLRKMASSESPDKAAAAAQLLGMVAGDDIESTLKKQLEIVRIGVVEPALELGDVVKIAEHYPTAFKSLWMGICNLTGMGAAATVKQPPSGSATTSESP